MKYIALQNVRHFTKDEKGNEIHVDLVRGEIADLSKIDQASINYFIENKIIGESLNDAKKANVKEALSIDDYIPEEEDVVKNNKKSEPEVEVIKDIPTKKK